GARVGLGEDPDVLRRRRRPCDAELGDGGTAAGPLDAQEARAAVAAERLQREERAEVDLRADPAAHVERAALLDATGGLQQDRAARAAAAGAGHAALRVREHARRRVATAAARLDDAGRRDVEAAAA